MLVLALVLLYFSFKEISWHELQQALKECKWGWIVLAIVLGFLEFVARGARWNLLLKQIDKDSSVSASYHGVTIGNLANFAFPRIGEFVRCGVVSTLKKKTTFEGALGTVVVERAWDLLCLIIAALVFALAYWKQFGHFFKTQMIDPASGKFSSISLILLAVAVLLFIVALIVFFAIKGKLSKTKIGSKIVSFVSNMWNGIKAALKLKNKWQFLFYTFFLWFCFLATSMCTIEAFSALAELGWKDALFLMIVGSFGWVVPVQGGIGAYHFIIALAVSQFYGVQWSDGVIYATISHESQVFAMIVCGVISVIYYTLRKRKFIDSRNTA